MHTQSKLRLADVFVSITDPRQPGKIERDLVELVVAVNAVLVGADTFVEVELWAKDNDRVAAAILASGQRYSFP